MLEMIKGFLVRLVICGVIYSFLEALLNENAGKQAHPGALRVVSAVLFAAALGI